MQSTTQGRPPSYAIYRDTAIAKLATVVAVTTRFLNAVAAVSFRFLKIATNYRPPVFTLLALPKLRVFNIEDVATAILPCWPAQGVRVIYKRSSCDLHQSQPRLQILIREHCTTRVAVLLMNLISLRVLVDRNMTLGIIEAIHALDAARARDR